MAVAIGKRKRSSISKDDRDVSSDEDDVRARFQRAFEAKFKPLETSGKPSEPAQSGREQAAVEDGQDSDWSGLSEDDDGVQGDEIGDVVEVVDHATSKTNRDGQARQFDMKSFMVSLFHAGHFQLHLLIPYAVF